MVSLDCRTVLEQMYRCWGLGAMVAALPIQRSIAGGWLLWLKMIWIVHQNPACEVLSDRTALSSRPGEASCCDLTWTDEKGRGIPIR
jgi:hypothetical protein